MTLKDADHVKLCQCKRCIRARAALFEERIREAMKQGMVVSSPDATVPVKSFTVRAHMRRNSRHLTKDPGLKAALGDLLSHLIRKPARRALETTGRRAAAK